MILLHLLLFSIFDNIFVIPFTIKFLQIYGYNILQISPKKSYFMYLQIENKINMK